MKKWAYNTFLKLLHVVFFTFCWPLFGSWHCTYKYSIYITKGCLFFFNLQNQPTFPSDERLSTFSKRKRVLCWSIYVYVHIYYYGLRWPLYVDRTIGTSTSWRVRAAAEQAAHQLTVMLTVWLSLHTIIHCYNTAVYCMVSEPCLNDNDTKCWIIICESLQM